MTTALLAHPPKNTPPDEARAATPLLGAMLDEIDYPMLLVSAGLAPLYMNKAARRRLATDRVFSSRPDGAGLAGLHRPLRLHLHRPADEVVLARAVAAACQRGLRTLLHVRDAGGDDELGDGLQTAIAVIPLPQDDAPALALLMLAKPTLCEALSVHGFARAHRLTACETRVLTALAAGLSPRAVAQDHGVLLSTVRTQITSLRTKCGARDSRELLRRVAELPPLVGVLQEQA